MKCFELTLITIIIPENVLFLGFQDPAFWNNKEFVLLFPFLQHLFVMKMEHLVLPMYLVNSFLFQEGGKEIFVSLNTILNSRTRSFSIPWVGWVR